MLPTLQSTKGRRGGFFDAIRDPNTMKLYQNRLDKVHRRIPVQKVSWTIVAMVGWNYNSPLAFLPHHINSDDYIKHFLKPIIKPFFKKQHIEAHRRQQPCK